MGKWEFIKTKSAIIRAVFALGVSLVVAILACYTCFAWFVVNDKVSADGADINVSFSNNISAEVTYYRMVTETTESNYGKYVTSTSAALGEYSLIDGNASCRLLIKMVFSGSFTSITLSAVTQADHYLGAYEAGNTTLKTQLAATGNSISSVIKFYYLDYTDVSLNGGAYTIGSLDGKSSYTFANISNETLTSKITLTTKTKEEMTDNTLYILLEYYEDAIVDIFGKNLGNDYSSSDNGNSSQDNETVTFINDFYFEAY